MDHRDILWIRQLLLEKQYADKNPSGPFPPPDRVWQLLDDVRYLVEAAEASIKYLKFWALRRNFRVDFDQLDEIRQQMRSSDHAVRVIEPFLSAFVVQN